MPAAKRSSVPSLLSLFLSHPLSLSYTHRPVRHSLPFARFRANAAPAGAEDVISLIAIDEESSDKQWKTAVGRKRRLPNVPREMRRGRVPNFYDAFVLAGLHSNTFSHRPTARSNVPFNFIACAPPWSQWRQNNIGERRRRVERRSVTLCKRKRAKGRVKDGKRPASPPVPGLLQHAEEPCSAGVGEDTVRSCPLSSRVAMHISNARMRRRGSDALREKEEQNEAVCARGHEESFSFTLITVAKCSREATWDAFTGRWGR